MKRVIDSAEAPAAVGAYSQATTDGSLLFTAGQIPLTPDGDLLDDEGVDVQTRQSLENIKAILEAEGLNMQDVLKVTVYLADIEDFDVMNDAYGEYFRDNPPARSAVQVGALPKGVDVEIEAIAAQRD
ncbi:Translation initiation inhibitor, yjgF family [Halanaeroarchaeum sp. HSR-CO]|uniref:Rid family detoxifying hydrolase n=1 Tax=Halanaeroarchaeum sp. HSR-CO TaxID=2866382 RepID=UPI00217D194B|nr:Rid family detoxifying hydrolase [Halanaeroarchaeum sp. HSR-CO]UWG46671.1 Translation initiation inhibitor, yjgF family [Halanaeroarchaeum sp. HSR-CO]